MSPTTNLLLALLTYGKHPATHNAQRWVTFIVPEDFLAEVERELADELELDTALWNLHE